MVLGCLNPHTRSKRSQLLLTHASARPRVDEAEANITVPTSPDAVQNGGGGCVNRLTSSDLKRRRTAQSVQVQRVGQRNLFLRVFGARVAENSFTREERAILSLKELA